MTSHIRFLETNKTVCQAPRTLGYDFVVIDYSEGESCQTCLTLILIHNQRSRQYDLLVTLPEDVNKPEEKDSPLVRALMFVFLAALVVWTTFAVTWIIRNA